MDASPFVNITQDSGLGESRNESNPSTLFTPTSSSIFSRKRKIIGESQISRSSSVKQSSSNSVESVDLSPWPTNANILSSTMNDSITTGVEKCKIDSFQANYYTERSDSDNTSFLKNIKEPTTPTKSGTKRFCNNNNASPRLSPLLKLGSPERNGLLYPNLQPNSSRFSDGKRCSPAKKCLFSSGLREVRKDPVSFFYGKDRDVYDIVKRIFLQLNDRDLYFSSKVCKNWKKAIVVDRNLRKRLKTYKRNKVMNKENQSPDFPITPNPCLNQWKQSTPIEPMPRMYELTNSLTEGQHLEKCIGCNKAEAVVEKNISQCTNQRCGMIRCLKCNSISKTGPYDFRDNCQQSILVLEEPTPRYNLLSSPSKRLQNDNGLPTFLMDDSFNTPNSRNSSYSRNSSGYLTDSEMPQSHRLSASYHDQKKGNISHILKVCNAKNRTPEKNWERRNSVLPVITSNRKIVEIIEPSSPPKVNYVACSKKSKRMLKRLKL